MPPSCLRKENERHIISHQNQDLFALNNEVNAWRTFTVVIEEQCFSLAIENEFCAIISYVCKVIKDNISGALEHYPELLGKYVKVGKIFHIIYVWQCLKDASIVLAIGYECGIQ